jgi:hypothetical protein
MGSSVKTYPPIRGVIETYFDEEVTVQTIETLEQQFFEDAKNRDIRVWVVNTLAVKKVSPLMTVPAASLVQRIRNETKCQHIIAAITDDTVRMIGRAITASGAMRLDIVTTMEEARAKARELISLDPLDP